METIDPAPLFGAASQARESFGRFNLAIAGSGPGKPTTGVPSSAVSM
ncbi:hypothetical protein OERS_38610 [Oerskovia enterophila]|uniref:Uncharacterized protein n=1 Tax=Oerskovia enterophila TaxID=43678 RepID=A0ABX2XZX6_9CELL|nr:hypothetical protein OERS_38610 [Oerskovia enterophila]